MINLIAQTSDTDAAGLGAALLIMGVLWLAAFVTWIYVFVQTCTTPTERFESVGSSKALWIVMQLLLGLIGSIAYWVVARPKVSAVRV